MALDQTQMEQQPQGQEAPQAERLTDEEEQDLDIAVKLAEEMIDDGGIGVIEKAIEQSNDPGQVVGQFLMQLGSEIGSNMPEDAQLSSRIWFAEGGWLEQVSDYLQEEYGIDKDTMDRAEVYVGTSAQEMARGAQQQAQPVQPSAPAMPQQGGM